MHIVFWTFVLSSGYFLKSTQFYLTSSVGNRSSSYCPSCSEKGGFCTATFVYSWHLGWRSRGQVEPHHPPRKLVVHEITSEWHELNLKKAWCSHEHPLLWDFLFGLCIPLRLAVWITARESWQLTGVILLIHAPIYQLWSSSHTRVFCTHFLNIFGVYRLLP